MIKQTNRRQADETLSYGNNDFKRKLLIANAILIQICATNRVYTGNIIPHIHIKLLITDQHLMLSEHSNKVPTEDCGFIQNKSSWFNYYKFLITKAFQTLSHIPCILHDW